MLKDADEDEYDDEEEEFGDDEKPDPKKEDIPL